MFLDKKVKTQITIQKIKHKNPCRSRGLNPGPLAPKALREKLGAYILEPEIDQNIWSKSGRKVVENWSMPKNGASTRNIG